MIFPEPKRKSVGKVEILVGGKEKSASHLITSTQIDIVISRTSQYIETS